jgi:hypothetical protein
MRNRSNSNSSDHRAYRVLRSTKSAKTLVVSEGRVSPEELKVLKNVTNDECALEFELSPKGELKKHNKGIGRRGKSRSVRSIIVCQMPSTNTMDITNPARFEINQSSHPHVKTLFSPKESYSTDVYSEESPKTRQALSNIFPNDQSDEDIWGDWDYEPSSEDSSSCSRSRSNC